MIFPSSFPGLGIPPQTVESSGNGDYSAVNLAMYSDLCGKIEMEEAGGRGMRDLGVFFVKFGAEISSEPVENRNGGSISSFLSEMSRVLPCGRWPGEGEVLLQHQGDQVPEGQPP